MGEPSDLNGLARDLASGRISRRAALRRLAGGAVGVAVASLPGAGALAAANSKRCPKERRCGDKCCPKHASCKRGKCKCDSRFTKCGKKCFDLQTNPAHCGDCDNPCAVDELCSDGICQSQQTCGNGQIEGTEVCDGTDLGGFTCQTLGFLGGTLACNGDCMSFNTSGCTGAPCSTPAGCPGQNTDCQTVTCESGHCGFDFAPMGTPVSEQTAGDCREVVCDGAGGMTGQNADDPFDDGNDCTMDACNGGVGSNPALPIGTVCSSNGGTVCDGNGVCVACNSPSDCAPSGNPCVLRTCNSNTCGNQNAPPSTQCAAATCSGSTLTPARTCNGAGTCGTTTPQSCTPYTCRDAFSCRVTCTVPADCVAGYTCAGNVCKKEQGQTCTGDSECATAFCTDGVCCQSRCGGICEKCNQAGRLGSCDPSPAGTDPDNECSGGTPNCNGARACG